LIILKGVLNPAGNWTGFDRITYSVNNGTLLRERIFTDSATGTVVPGESGTLIIARNVEALRFQFSADLNAGDWDNNFLDQSGAVDVERKRDIQFIRVFVVLRDERNLSPVNSENNDNRVPGTPLYPAGRTMREIHEIVIPVPNNGRFPPNA
jgi:hypothetical protein